MLKSEVNLQFVYLFKLNDLLLCLFFNLGFIDQTWINRLIFFSGETGCLVPRPCSTGQDVGRADGRAADGRDPQLHDREDGDATLLQVSLSQGSNIDSLNIGALTLGDLNIRGLYIRVLY